MNLSHLKQICGQSEFWPLLYPRMYTEVDRFGDPALPACGLTMAVENERQTEKPGTAIFSHISSLLLRNNVPAMFLSRAFATAARHSPPPSDLFWASMPLPFDAGLLMLPKNWLIHPDHGAVDFIGYARLRQDDALVPLGFDASTAFDDDGFVIWTILPDEDLSSLTQMIKLEDKPRVRDVATSPEERFFYEPQNKQDQYMPENDFNFLDAVTMLTFSVLLAINARPSLIKRGHRGSRHKKSGLPIWTPNIVGRDYRLQSEAASNTLGGSVRLHWRRGHYRQQRFGTGLSEQKIIWLEPVLVGGEK